MLFIPHTFCVLVYLGIGGIFSPFAGEGLIAVDQAENLAAFLMAVGHINNKTDGIADDILPNSQLKIALRTGNSFAGTIKAVDSLLGAFYNTGVLGVVSGQPTAEVEAANQMLKDFGIVQVHSVGMDTSLGEGVKYPYKIQMPPIDSFQGIHMYIWNHVQMVRISPPSMFITASSDGWSNVNVNVLRIYSFDSLSQE
jgi:hypothetical protein